MVPGRALRDVLPARGPEPAAAAARGRRCGLLARPAVHVARGGSLRVSGDACGRGAAGPRLLGAHARVPRLRRLPADHEAHAPRVRLAEPLLLPARALRPAAADRLREDREVRDRPGPGAALEEPARLVRVHRVRPLQLGLPGARHRQAAPADEGAPRREAQPARPQAPLVSEAEIDRRARRRARGRRLLQGRRPGPPGRALGLHHLRRLRPGLPGPDRLRAGDARRPAPEPGHDGVELPAGSHERLQGTRDQGQSLGPRPGPADGVGRGARRPAHERARRARGRVPALGRLRRSHRPARAQDQPGARPDPEGRRRRLRDARLRGALHRRSRRGASGTSTSSRSSPRRTSRRSSRTASARSS